LYARAARHRTVGSLSTVTISCVWATGRRCTVAALQPPLSTRLAGAWCQLVVMHLKRYAHSPTGDHDGHARRISVYFNSTYIVGPSRDTWRSWSCPGLGSRSWSRRTRGGLGAAPGWAAGAEAAGHVAAPELPELGSGSWSRGTHGGPGAVPGCAAGAGAAGHVMAPELPCAMRLMLRLWTRGSM
jgi:hypothetical protein